MKGFLTLFLLGAGFFGFSQCISINSSVSTTSCLEEKITISNTTIASSFEWDFCTGNLKQTPTLTGIGSLPNFVGAIDIEIVKDGDNWFGFVLTYQNKITRMDFGSSLGNPTPAFSSLGNPDNILSSPGGMDLVKEGANWYGVIVNANSSQIVLLSFGTSLANTPTTSVLGLSLAGADPYGIITLVPNQSGGFTALVTEYSSRKIRVIPFPDGLTQPAGTPTLITVPVSPLDVQVMEVCGEWSAFVLGFDNGAVYRYDFGNSILNAPSAPVTVATFPLYIYRLWAVREGDEFHCFVAKNSGGIHRIDFGTDLRNNTPSTTDLGNFSGALQTTNSLRVVNNNGLWHLFTVNGTSDSPVSRISFPENCGASISISNANNPSDVSYTASGSKKISLTAFQSGITTSTSFALTVQNLTVPDIDFTFQNICVNNDINFSSQNTSGNIVSYDWDFGDLSSHSFIQNPIKQYSSSAQYDVSLNVTASNGCKNAVSKKLKIYNPPAALFTPPSGLICTNNEFTFTNNTVDNFDGNLTYQWLVDNSPTSTSRDLKYTFTSNGDKIIKLVTSIPGCSDESAQTVQNVQSGPIVGFTITGKCEDETISFINTSSGAIAGYSWDLGNGQTSTNTDASQIYPDKGNYVISLTTNGTNGCVSSTSKPLTIYSKPSPNFSIDLPPFSCSGLPTQITDNTPLPSDSNLSSWVWNFGDVAAGTSTDQNPVYTFASAGDYNVSLTATTNFGCSASTQKTITIASSPVAAITNTAACANQGTRFDASDATIKSWLWTMGNSTYTFSTPTHVFAVPGSYDVNLTLTGNNDCYTTITKKIVVPQPPTLNFSAQNLCEGQLAVFKDTSAEMPDVPIAWSWDFASKGTTSGLNAQYTFVAAGSYPVKLTSTYQSGCIYSLTKNITIAPAPITSFTASPEWGVPPLTVQFTNQSTGANTYVWNFNDQKNSTSTSTSPTFQFTELGDYVVDLLATNAQGCFSTFSKKISVIIPSLDVELKELQLIKDPTSGAYRMLVTVKNNSNFTLTSTDVVVDISGNSLIKETLNASILPDAEITQLLNSQILSRGDLFTYLCASVEVSDDKNLFNNKICEPVNQESVVFSPYPNPSDGNFRFDWISPSDDTGRFALFNSMGQQVLEQEIESIQQGLNQVQFNLKNITPGRYYLRFISNSVSKTIPIQITN